MDEAAASKSFSGESTVERGRQPLRAGFLVHDVSRLRRTAFDQRVKPLGITRSQWWVLADLSRHTGEAMTQIELARMLDVGKVTLGGLIDRLEGNGLVKRTSDKADRRSKRISVTAKGQGLVKRLEAVALEMNEKIMKGISTKQQLELEDMLAIMRRNLVAMDTVPTATRSKTAAKKTKSAKTKTRKTIGKRE